MAVKVAVIVGVTEGVGVIDGVSVAVGLTLGSGVGVWVGAGIDVAVSGGRLIELTWAGVAVAQAERKRATTDKHR